jgi:hypothetical protein
MDDRKLDIVETEIKRLLVKISELRKARSNGRTST